MNRRTFVAGAAAGWAAMAVSRVLAESSNAGPVRPVRLGVVGVGNRGRYLLSVLVRFPGVQALALCDLDRKSLEQAAEVVTKAGGAAPELYTGDRDAYPRMLARQDIDAIVIATPTKWHCAMAIQAMKSGKHVASEVPAGFQLNELWELVKAKEATGKRYILLENYLYWRPNMMIWNMARQGLFGDLYHAECSYIHDCRSMLFKKDGTLDWWGEWAKDNYGSDYPTHALGPVSKWMGLNEGDRMTHCSAMMTRPRVLKEFAAKKYGPDSPQGRINWAEGDYMSVLIQTDAGRMIRVDYDVNSPRPVSHFYLIQGTKGVYDSRKGLFFEGEAEQWTPEDKYKAKYDHPYWTRDGAEAAKAGHGGGDYFVLRDFVNMVREDREPWADVYDAASWSVIYHCSRESIDRKGGVVEIPDFTGGEWKHPDWRKDAHRPA